MKNRKLSAAATLAGPTLEREKQRTMVLIEVAGQAVDRLAQGAKVTFIGREGDDGKPKD